MEVSAYCASCIYTGAFQMFLIYDNKHVIIYSYFIKFYWALQRPLFYQVANHVIIDHNLGT